MSSNGGESDGGSNDSGPGRREVAHRLFATEFDAATLEHTDSDEERAPKYVITPTGARVNRLFVVGVLTEIERVNDDVVRARVVDPTGAFVVYAGQYQPDALAFLERADPPMFIAVTGKANTFQPEDSDRVFTSIRPESIAEVDGETRDRWTVQATAHTLRRVSEFANALETEHGGFEGSDGIALAREEYATTPAYLAALRETALGAARLVAGEVEEVTAPVIEPGADDGQPVDLAALQGGLDDRVSPVEGTESGEGKPVDDPTDSTDASESPSAEPELTAEEPTVAEPETNEAPEGSEPSSDDAASVSTEEKTAGSDDLGDFDAGEPDPAEAESAAGVETETEAVGEGERYEFDEEERAEIEAEFDMGFSSGSEVDDPGEAGIDVPDEEPADADIEDMETEVEPELESDPKGVAEPTDGDFEADEDNAGDEADEADESVNIEDRAMDAMGDLADGDGADREAVIERVASEHGVDAATVDDAIDSALLSGRCYEPQDGVLKPI